MIKLRMHNQFDKVRNQSTGAIEGFSLHQNTLDSKNKTILITDDLCDGGGTFIQASKQLQKFNLKRIDPCVSHGIFSKGQKVLHDAGIENIFTTNSLLKNHSGFSVWK